MIEKVISTVKKHNMFLGADTIIAAVSGGADSMAMLNILCSLRQEFGFELIVAHVNHGIRKYEADRDENFVINFCHEKKLRLETLRVNIPQISKSSGEGIEECARRIRYEFFSSIAENALIATAHTLSDRIETMLFNLARGTGLEGLCSIKPVRDNIIRPLIDCTTEEVKTYCEKYNIPFVFDSSNSDEKYSRNYLRKSVIPLFGRINQNYQLSFLRCFDNLTEDNDFLNIMAEQLVAECKKGSCYSAAVLASSSPAIRKRAVKNILISKLGSAPLSEHINALDDLLFTGGSITLPGDTRATVKNEKLIINNRVLKVPPFSVKFDIGELLCGSKKVTVTVADRTEFKNQQIIHNKLLDYSLDYDKLNGNVVFRNRRGGDRIRISKRNCTKTLKKLFNEDSVPEEIRDDLLVLADDSGVAWLEGYGSDRRCEISESTKNILIIKIGSHADDK